MIKKSTTTSKSALILKSTQKITKKLAELKSLASILKKCHQYKSFQPPKTPTPRNLDPI